MVKAGVVQCAVVATLLLLTAVGWKPDPKKVFIPVPVPVLVPVPVPVPVRPALLTQQTSIIPAQPVPTYNQVLPIPAALPPKTSPLTVTPGMGPCPGNDPKVYVSRVTSNPFYLCTHGRADVHVSAAFIVRGFWFDCTPLERVIRSIRKSLGMPPDTMLTVVDVGGNIGSCSWVMASEGAMVTAFEPVYKNYAVFAKSNELNKAKYGDRITLHNKGCGKAKSTATMRSEKGNMGNSVITTDKSSSHLNILTEGRRVSWEDAINIEITTLDSEIHTHVHFMKMDCQGHEIEALLGATTLLKTHGVDVIKAEFFTDFLVSSGHKARELLDILHENNYEVLFHGRVVPPSTFEVFQKNKKGDIFAVKKGLISQTEYYNLR